MLTNKGRHHPRTREHTRNIQHVHTFLFRKTNKTDRRKTRNHGLNVKNIPTRAIWTLGTDFVEKQTVEKARDLRKSRRNSTKPEQTH